MENYAHQTYYKLVQTHSIIFEQSKTKILQRSPITKRKNLCNNRVIKEEVGVELML